MLSACFDGDGTLGAFCEQDADCGGEQACRNEICGACDNGVPELGEVCLSDPTVTAAGSRDVTIAAIDADADGQLELVTYSPGQGASSEMLTLWTVDDAGELGSSSTIGVQADVHAVAVGDLDGDGIDDLAIGTGEAVAVAYGPELEPGPRVVLGFPIRSVAVGRFVDGQSVVVGLGSDPSGQGDRVMAVGWSADRSGTVLGEAFLVPSGSEVLGPIRVDGDRLDDFVIVSPGTTTALRSEGPDAPFNVVESFALDGSVLDAAVFGLADDDRGRLALLTDGGAIVIAAGTVDGSLAMTEEIDTVGGTATTLAGIDLDRDRISDLALGGPEGVVGVLLRPAIESFSITLDPDAAATDLASGPFDADPFVDLLAFDRQSGVVRILRGAP